MGGLQCGQTASPELMSFCNKKAALFGGGSFEQQTREIVRSDSERRDRHMVAACAARLKDDLVGADDAATDGDGNGRGRRARVHVAIAEVVESHRVRAMGRLRAVPVHVLDGAVLLAAHALTARVVIEDAAA